MLKHLSKVYWIREGSASIQTKTYSTILSSRNKRKTSLTISQEFANMIFLFTQEYVLTLDFELANGLK